MDFILGERLCLVSYADEPRKAGERPSRQHFESMILRDDNDRKLDDFVAPISLEELARLHEIKRTFKGRIAK